MSKTGPSYISFHITNRCNCRCSHCDIWKQRDTDSPPTEDFERVIDDVADWAGQAEVIIAGGEPLLSPHTLPLIRSASGFALTTLLATNGFAIDEPMADELAKAGLSIANVSLDGFDHTHDKIRKQPGAFEQVIKAVGLLYDRGIMVRIATVIMEDNLDQITGLLDFLTKDGRVNGVFFQAMAQPFGSPDISKKWWKSHPHFPKDTRRVQELLDEILAMKRGGFFILNEDSQFPAMKAYFANPERFTQAMCTVGDLGFSINGAGDVLLCSFFGPIGNIREGRIREIFESEKARALREKMHGCKDNCHLLINCSFDPTQLLIEEPA